MRLPFTFELQSLTNCLSVDLIFEMSLKGIKKFGTIGSFSS